MFHFLHFNYNIRSSSSSSRRNVTFLCLLFRCYNFCYLLTTGRDLIGVQNLMKKQQALSAELAGHDSRIVIVSDSGKEMIEDGHFASDDINHKITSLNERWQVLNVSALLIQCNYSM